MNEFVLFVDVISADAVYEIEVLPIDKEDTTEVGLPSEYCLLPNR